MGENTEVATSGGAPQFDIADFITDPIKTEQGVWRKLGKDRQGQDREIKLAKLTNDEYQRYMRGKQRVNQALLEQNDEEANNVAIEMVREGLALHIIKGLRVGGKDVPYSPQTGVDMLMNKDFLKKVKDLAEQLDPYLLEATEVKS